MVLSQYTYIFSESGKFYLFNAESLFFSEISEEFYEIINGRQWDCLPDNLLSNLKEKRILIPDDEKYTYFYDAKTRFLTEAYGSKIMSLIIALTGCNF